MSTYAGKKLLPGVNRTLSSRGCFCLSEPLDLLRWGIQNTFIWLPVCICPVLLAASDKKKSKAQPFVPKLLKFREKDSVSCVLVFVFVFCRGVLFF